MRADGPAIELAADEAARLEGGALREWIEAHGDGSFAMGTVSGALTRRYHALLVAALPAPLGRIVTLSKIDETLYDARGTAHRLTTNLFPGDVHGGHQTVRQFALSPFPTWRLSAADVELERVVVAARGEPATVVRWRHLAGSDAVLELRPFFAMRPFHEIRRATDARDFQLEVLSNAIVVRVPRLPAVRLSFEGELARDEAIWQRFLLPEEERRGLEAYEDLFTPGVIRLRLAALGTACIVVSLHGVPSIAGEAIEHAERMRRAKLVAPFQGLRGDVTALADAADRFRASIGERRTIVAGFPWFEDWGRDTMIALPGLLLCCGLIDEAARVLEDFADEMAGGLIPNRFPDGSPFPEFHSVDAALLFVEAVRLWIAYGGDPDRLDERLYPRVLEVVAHYARGTLHGIGCDDDGLIAASSPHHALTWMDACVDGAAVTPRRGKPVEIQALWYNALCVAADLAMARRKTELAGGLRALAQRTANTFRARFWMPALGYCADVVDPHEAPAPGVPFGPGTTDERMRPNQLFAASLGHTMLLPAERERLVDAVRDELLTPRGLRTLAPGASGYRARFEGGPRERDEGYHQGAVWPWLLGPYARALVSARGSIDAARREARAALEPVLARAIEEHCLGQIAEVYDSEAPQRAAGCPAQAMSVAEVLRAWLEIVEGRGPAAGVRPGRFDVTRIELVDLA